MARWGLRGTVLLGVLMFAAVAVMRAIWDGPYEEIRDSLWRVELGTPMEVVSSTVPFEPIRTEEWTDERTGRAIVAWYYDHHPVAAVVPALTFDNESRRVISVAVADGKYRDAPH
ncbi:MAG: hypothetical protein HKN37_05840 [Rhodothermales bacterium]|nr:hypothetical protein [Rhodothermales bacterium]